MHRRRPRSHYYSHRLGIRLPACLCLLAALALFCYAKVGGEGTVRQWVQQLATNDNFLLTALALESGIAPEKQSAVRDTLSPVAVAAGTQQSETEQVDIAQSGYVPTPSDTAKEVTGGTKSSTVTINNSTDLSYDLATMLANPLTLHSTGEGPQVMIISTHSTEAYTPDEAHPYVASETDRTLDTRYNVVRVGDEIADILESRGIGVVHCREIFDNPAYSGAYDRSLVAITKQLQETPSIQIIIDVHRDSMIASDGTEYKTACTVDGKKMAQLMLVVGSNAGGLTHDNWKQNLNYAVNLQSRIAAQYPTLMRPVNLRKQRFNQSARSPGSMLIEVGSSGNTLTEAIDAATLFADALADSLLNT